MKHLVTDPVPQRSRGSLWYVAVLALSVGYSWWVATTRPFSDAADIAVAVGFVVGAPVAIWGFRRRSPRPAGSLTRAGVIPWLLVIALLLGIELFSYFAAPAGARAEYPTLSSLYDSAAKVEAVKAIVVFLWLGFGWVLFAP